MKQKQLWILAATILALVACGGETRDNNKVDKQIDQAYRAKDYPKLMALADSLGQNGTLTEAEAYYWQGYASERMMQKRMAEFFWKTSMTAVENSEKQEDVDIYARSASRLTNVLGTRGESESALKIAVPAAERLEKLKRDSTSDYINLLIYIGCCQSRFGMSDEEVNKSFERAYKMHMRNIDKTHSDEAYKDAIAGVINIAFNFNDTKHYQEALKWTDRYGELVSKYEMATGEGRSLSYTDKQWARYNVYRAIALEGLNRHEEAAKVYNDFLETDFSKTPEGQFMGNDYLMAAKRWMEAAVGYETIDQLLNEYNTGYSLENLQNMMLKKYRANKMAGRNDSALAVSLIISEKLDAAISKARLMEAQEQETIRHKEAEILDQKTEINRKRQIGGLIALGIFALAFLAYILYRHRIHKRHVKAHDDLKTAYDKLETDTTGKERAGSELRIATNIQQMFVPKQFPLLDNIGLFASLTPSKEVGGNFFDYLIRDNMLFFCIGDVAEKGVPAAITLATVKSEFHAAAAHESLPQHIVSTINQIVTEGSDTPIAVTLFVGALDLLTGRMIYTNAGHTAPVLVGSGIGLLPIDQNTPVGQQANSTFTSQSTLIDPGTVIFLYTNGVTEAENNEHDTFGKDRMMGEALQVLHGKDSSPKAIIDSMNASILRFTDGAEQNDDMAMMAIRYTPKSNGATYQRSISLSNDVENEVPRLTRFTENVCEALHLNDKISAGIKLALEEAVVNVMNYAYSKDTKGDVHIEACADQSTLRFVIRDHGQPFDPTSVPEADTSQPAEERPIGGLGVHIIRQYMDTVHYERTDGENVFTIAKQFKKA